MDQRDRGHGPAETILLADVAGPAIRNNGSFWPLRYLASLSPARQVLWCYLIWYGFVFEDYFDPSPSLWLSSLGIAGLIGTALYLSTAFAGRARVQLEPWQVARFYLMPFCVSSYAALIKDQGFVLIFHPNLADNLRSAAACAAFVAVSAAAKRLRLTAKNRQDRQATPKSPSEFADLDGVPR